MSKIPNKILLKIGRLSFILLALTAQLAGAVDFRQWHWKLPVTFTGYSRAETLTNFPALVVLSTNLSGFLYSNFQTNRADLRFTDASLTNELNYEVESWNTNGSSYVWVQIPRLTSNALIYAYWGKDDATTVPAYTTNGATWADGFIGVWHMSQTNVQDSTANRSHAITTAGVTNTTGTVNGANAFAGTASSGYLVITNSAVLEPAQVTVSTWLKWTGAGTHSDGNYPVTKGRSGGAPWISYNLVHRPSDNKFGASIGVGGSQSVLYDTAATASNTFAYVATTYTSGAHRFYRDGAICSTNATSGIINYTMTDHDLHIGDWGLSGYVRRFQGVVDEVQISSVVRSSNWIWAAYMNMASNGVFAGSFNTYSNVTAGGSPVIANSAATDITGTSATLNGNLSATGQFATVVGVYWGTNDADMVKGNWTTNAWLGTQPTGTLAQSISSLSAGTRYYYRFLATNTAGESWAPASDSFMTLGGPIYADNGTGASNITASTALLRGTVTGGSPAATVYFFWNTADGGTDKTAWTNVLTAGTASTNSVSATLSGLVASQTYFYRCYGSNIYGDVWAPVSTNFTTPAPTLAIGDAEATKGPAGVNVVLSFPVTLSATTAIPVTVDFSTSNGLAIAGTDYTATNGTLNLPAGSGSGQINVTVLGGNVEQWPSVDLYLNLSNVTQAVLANTRAHGVIWVTNDIPEVKTWTGVGDWTSRTNWIPVGIPGSADQVFISSGTVGVSSATTYVPSLVVSNGAMMTFSNWTSVLRAGNLTIRNGGIVTHAPCATNLAPGNTNRVYIVCTNLTVDSGGSINVAGMGYPGGDSISSNIGYGPGGGSGIAGASHGGRGYLGPNTYGSATLPTTPGSGGFNTNSGGGGGVVWIEASGTATVNGVISANGGSSGINGHSSGSGGSIYMNCRVLAGTNNGASGVISADGKTSGDYGHPNVTAGGGRIAIVYNSAAQSNALRPTIIFSASSINGTSAFASLGEPGTLYFPDTQLLTELIRYNGQLLIPGFTQWNPANLTLSNAWFRFPDALDLTVGGNLSVVGANSALDLRYGNLRVASNFTARTTVLYPASVVAFASNSVVRIGQNLTLSNSVLRVYGPATNSGQELVIGADCVVTGRAELHIYAGATNAGMAQGLTMGVTGDISVATSSWIYVYSEPTNGGSVYCTMRDLTIAAGGTFDATAKGYSDGYPTHTTGFGPGGGSPGGGGGYGGAGGGGAAGGVTYGNSNAPTMPGSGGGCVDGSPNYPPFVSRGGGLIWIGARTITLNGTISANGANKGNYWQYSGSGGGVYLRCTTWAGTGGVLRAKGGDGNATTQGRGAAGGGGRIAVWREYDQYIGSVSNNVAGGIGFDSTAHGQPGTVVWKWMPHRGTVIAIH